MPPFHLKMNFFAGFAVNPAGIYKKAYNFQPCSTGNPAPAVLTVAV
jgi:hypothetical protein